MHSILNVRRRLIVLALFTFNAFLLFVPRTRNAAKKRPVLSENAPRRGSLNTSKSRPGRRGVRSGGAKGRQTGAGAFVFTIYRS